MSVARSLTLAVEGMSCASCVGRVERALAAVPGVREARVNLASESAQVDFDPPADAGALVAALDKAGYPARERSVVLEVEAMTCASCVGRVERALAAVPGVLKVNVNLASETATVTFLEGQTDAAALGRAAGAAGYPAKARGSDTPSDMGARKEVEARDLT